MSALRSRQARFRDALLGRPVGPALRTLDHVHASPPGFWYDQDDNEWVVVLSGSAEIEFEDEAQSHQLAPGDWVDIRAHRRHRVNWTDPLQPTVWLAIHYR